MTTYIFAALIANSVALAVGAVLVAVLTAAWLKAEWKVYKLGGETKCFRDPRKKK